MISRRLLLCAFIASAATNLHAYGLELLGRVVDKDNAPVSNALVWLDQERMVQTAKTDKNGAFRFDDVRVGPVEVVARKEGLALGGYTGFVIDDGDVAISLVAPAQLELRIVDPAYEPVPGARIRGVRINGTFNVTVEDLVEHGFPQLRSDDTGLLRLAELPEGAFVEFVVTHLEYADTGVPYLPLMKTRQDIVLTPGVELRGRVTAEGRAVAKADVVLFVESDKGDQRMAESLSDSDGFYRLRAPEGLYRLAARHPDFAAAVPVQVHLKDEPAEHVADIALLPARIISGRVVGPDDEPRAGVRVAYRAENTIYEETLTQNDGTFRVKAGAPTGSIQVVPPPGFITEKLAVIPFDLGDSREAALSPIRIVPLPEVHGRVLDTDGKPATGALVSSLNLSPPFWAITDEKGVFSIRLGHSAEGEKARFRAEHPLRFLRTEFEVDPRAAKPVEAQLAAFEPDLADRPVEPMHNDLSGLVGKKAPEFKCDAWFNTSALSLADLAGKVIVLHFWGLFDDSAYNMNRLVELRALHDLLRGVDDVAIVAIHDASVEPPEVENFIRGIELPYAVGCDADPFFSFINYGVNVIPQTVLIDKEGTLRYFQVEGRLLELIKDLRRRAS